MVKRIMAVMVRSASLKYVGAGVLLGLSTILPGVSAGTTAVILGIYTKFTRAIALRSLRISQPEARRSCYFLLLIAMGATIGIFGFATLLERLIATATDIALFGFIGLIVGTIPYSFRHSIAKTRGHSHAHRLVDWLVYVLAFAVGIVLVLLPSLFGGGQSIEQLIANGTAYGGGSALRESAHFVGVGALAGSAMVIPGVSGAFVLLILDSYHAVLQAVSQLEFAILIPVAIGAAIGVLVCAKIIRTLFARFAQPMWAWVTGLLVGSVFQLWSGFPPSSIETVFALLVAGCCCAVVVWLHRRMA